MGQIKKKLLDTFIKTGRSVRKLIFQSEYLKNVCKQSLPLSFKEQLSLLKSFPKFTDITIYRLNQLSRSIIFQDDCSKF
jgi:hypothetical protein